MKFSNKAGCKIAERRDIDFAAAQNGLVAFEVNGESYGRGGIGREERSSVATKPLMASSREKVPIYLLLSFAFLLAGLAFFVKATVKNVKQIKKMRKSSFCGDDNSTIRTERLINRNASTAATDEIDDEIMSTISRISSKISPQAKLVRIYSGDEGGSHCGNSNHSFPSTFQSESDFVKMDEPASTVSPTEITANMRYDPLKNLSIHPNEGNRANSFASDFSYVTKNSQKHISEVPSEKTVLNEEHALSLITSDLAALKQALFQFTQPLTLQTAALAPNAILKPSRFAPTDTRPNPSTSFDEGVMGGKSNSKSRVTRENLQSLEQVDENTERWIHLGNDLISSGNYEDAFKAYSEAILLSPTSPQSHVYYSKRAAASLFLMNYREAAEDARWSIALEPTFAKGHARLGQALHFSEDLEGAIVAYEDALRNAEDADAGIYHSYLAEAKKELKKQNAEKYDPNGHGRKSTKSYRKKRAN